MTKRDWFLLISTLIIGIFTGMYLYFVTFVPAYIANPMAQELLQDEEPAWRLTAEAYGGCQMIGRCPRYELTAAGEVRYQPSVSAAIEEARIPQTLLTYVNEAVTTTNLAAASRAAQKTCAHWSDGLDYGLTVDEAAGSYTLDTCDTALSLDDPLTDASREVFRYLESPDEYQLSIEVGSTTRSPGIRGFLERTLDETFDYDDQ